MGKKLDGPRSDSLVNEWMTYEGLEEVKEWAAIGFTNKDMADKMGVTLAGFHKWLKQYPELKQAISEGKAKINSRVENALLKAALGYRTRESRITTIMRFGKVVETQKETIDKDQPPNITAAQTWLYNRMPDTWKHHTRREAGILDGIEEDASIHITVERAKAKEIEEESGWDTEVNETVSLSKAEATEPPPEVQDPDYWPDDWDDEEGE